MSLRRVLQPIHAAYEHLAMVLGLGFLALLCLAWLPLAQLLHILLPRRQGQRLGRWVIHRGFGLYLKFLRLFCACRFDLGELQQLREAGPLVLAANHPSLLDAVLITACLPNVTCIMKAALMDNPLFGAAARLACYIRNNAPIDMVRQAQASLAEGVQVLIFPEGTRTADFPLSPCGAGAGLIAHRANVPVQTLIIDFSSPYLGKHWPLLRRPRLPLRASIRLGQRFAPPDNVAAFSTMLEGYFHQELAGPGAPTLPPQNEPASRP